MRSGAIFQTFPTKDFVHTPQSARTIRRSDQMCARREPDQRFERAILFTNMIHEILPVGVLQCNCSVLGDETTHEAIVVDPGDDIDEIMKLLERHHLQVKFIAITHAHIDHVGGAKKLKERRGAPVYMNENDLELLEQVPIQASWIGVAPPEVASIDVLLREGDTIQCGEIRASVLHTPGHTQGSVCLLL